MKSKELKIEGTSLKTINCSAGSLISLNVSKCTALTSLNCGSIQLTSLDVSKCTALTSLDCYSNQLTSSALNSLFRSLPTTSYGYIGIYSNPGALDCDKTIAENKGWNVRLY
jgi:Leucine-rich repeat (LRR) protein